MKIERTKKAPGRSIDSERAPRRGGNVRRDEQEAFPRERVSRTISPNIEK